MLKLLLVAVVLLLAGVSSQSAAATEPLPTATGGFPPTKAQTTAAKKKPTTVAAETTPTKDDPTTPAPLQEFVKPIYDKELNRKIKILPLGSSDVVKCDIESETNDIRILWYKDDNFVQNFTSQLHVAINTSDIESAGTYECRLGNKTDRTDVFITDIYPLTTELGQNDSSSTDTVFLKYKTGTELALNVSINVYPIKKVVKSVSFMQIADDVTMKVSEGVDITKNVKTFDDVLSYSVSDVKWAYNGYYNFEIEYGTKRTEIMFMVAIMEEPEIVEFQELPAFVMYNETVTIQAKVTGHPPPKLHWFHQQCCIDNNLISINDAAEGDNASYQISGQTLTLFSNEQDQEVLNGTYWFTVEHELNSNLTSAETEYIIKGWGIDVDTPNTTLYENMGEFVLACEMNSSEKLAGDYQLKFLLNGDILTTIQNVEYGNETVLFNTPSESYKGTYQCVAENENVTLWSKEINVEFVPQPTFMVSPKEYSVVAGDTAIFSCKSTGVEESDPVRFYVADNPVVGMALHNPPPSEPALLYLENVRDTQYVKCNKTHKHPLPIYNIVSTKIVTAPVVTVKTSLSKSPYHKKGDTVVIRCDISTELFATETPNIFWKHNKTVYSYNGSKGNIHMYDNGVLGNKTTHILAIQYVDDKKHNGTYTCIFDSPSSGRYEDYVEIIIKEGLTHNLIALVLGGSLLVLILLLIIVVLMLLRHKYRREGYPDECTTVSNKLVKNEIIPIETSHVQETDSL